MLCSPCIARHACVVLPVRSIHHKLLPDSNRPPSKLTKIRCEMSSFSEMKMKITSIGAQMEELDGVIEEHEGGLESLREDRDLIMNSPSVSVSCTTRIARPARISTTDRELEGHHP